jgi:hypothetical protein
LPDNDAQRRADHYRRLLWDVIDQEIIDALHELIAIYDQRAAELAEPAKHCFGQCAQTDKDRQPPKEAG